MGNQPDYTYSVPPNTTFFHENSRRFILHDDRRTIFNEVEFIANSIVSVVKLWRIATLYINVGNTENRALIN